MQQNYNRERHMPVVLTATVEDLQLILALAKTVGAMDLLPDDVWSNELRELTANVKAALHGAAREAADHFEWLAANVASED